MSNRTRAALESDLVIIKQALRAGLDDLRNIQERCAGLCLCIASLGGIAASMTEQLLREQPAPNEEPSNGN